MPATTTRIITLALAILALAAPVAGAAPIRDGSPSLQQDHSRPDANVYVIPAPLFKQQPAAAATAHHARPSVADTGDRSPLVYIVPSLVLVAMLTAATVYIRGTRQIARA